MRESSSDASCECRVEGTRASERELWVEDEAPHKLEAGVEGLQRVRRIRRWRGGGAIERDRLADSQGERVSEGRR